MATSLTFLGWWPARGLSRCELQLLLLRTWSWSQWIEQARSRQPLFSAFKVRTVRFSVYTSAAAATIGSASAAAELLPGPGAPGGLSGSKGRAMRDPGTARPRASQIGQARSTHAQGPMASRWMRQDTKLLLDRPPRRRRRIITASAQNPGPPNSFPSPPTSPRPRSPQEPRCSRCFRARARSRSPQSRTRPPGLTPPVAPVMVPRIPRHRSRARLRRPQRPGARAHR